LIAVYFGFFLSCAFLPSIMAHAVFANSPISLAMVVGAAIMAGLVVITRLYVSSADRI
jgi:uncharacterized membrane protein (DUF485 family)